MYKKFGPIFILYSLYEDGQDFSDTQYIYENVLFEACLCFSDYVCDRDKW